MWRRFLRSSQTCSIKSTRYVRWKDKHQTCSIKGSVCKNFAISSEKYPCWSHFLIKSTTLGLQLYQKETPRQMLSCEYSKIFNNTYLEEHLWKDLQIVGFFRVFSHSTLFKTCNFLNILILQLLYLFSASFWII